MLLQILVVLWAQASVLSAGQLRVCYEVSIPTKHISAPNFHMSSHLDHIKTDVVFSENCTFQNLGGFLKFICHDESTSYTKCPYSNEYYTISKYNKTTGFNTTCSNDAHLYQACDTRLTGTVIPCVKISCVAKVMARHCC